MDGLCQASACIKEGLQECLLTEEDVLVSDSPLSEGVVEELPPAAARYKVWNANTCGSLSFFIENTISL